MQTQSRRWGAVVAVWLALQLGAAFAGAQEIPDCMDKHRVLPVDNSQVLHWKDHTPNQFLARARVKGEIVRVFKDRSGHDHFEISLGSASDEVLEVVYNTAFGKIPAGVIKPGAMTEVCGDYITSTAPTAHYPASPSGAIIHWIHRNPRPGKHDHGYLVIENRLFGWN